MSGIHVLILFLTLATVAFADFQGLRWVLGWVQTLNERVMHVLHWVVYAGLAGMVITGYTMFARDSEYLLSNPTFLAKMMFVTALIINSFLIGKHMKIASKKPFAEIDAKEKRWLLVSGVISSISWLTAMLLGFSLE